MKACERRNFDFCLFLRVGSLPGGRVGHCVMTSHTPFSLYKPVLTDRLPTRKNTQKSKFLVSQAFKWKKIMFFVIPEMPSTTFVMSYKKLPDHFKIIRIVAEEAGGEVPDEYSSSLHPPLHATQTNNLCLNKLFSVCQIEVFLTYRINIIFLIYFIFECVLMKSYQ